MILDCTSRFLECRLEVATTVNCNLDYKEALDNLETYNRILFNQYSISKERYISLKEGLADQSDAILSLITSIPIKNIDTGETESTSTGIEIVRLLYPLVSASVLKVIIYEKHGMVAVKFIKDKA